MIPGVLLRYKMNLLILRWLPIKQLWWVSYPSSFDPVSCLRFSSTLPYKLCRSAKRNGTQYTLLVFSIPKDILFRKSCSAPLGSPNLMARCPVTVGCGGCQRIRVLELEPLKKESYTNNLKHLFQDCLKMIKTYCNYTIAADYVVIKGDNYNMGKDQSMTW